MDNPMSQGESLSVARAILFYSTPYIAALMLAVDTGIRRSSDLLARAKFLRSMIWGFLPLILLLIFGGLQIYSYFFPKSQIEELQHRNSDQEETIKNQAAQIARLDDQLSASQREAKIATDKQKQIDDQSAQIQSLQGRISQQHQQIQNLQNRLSAWQQKVNDGVDAIEKTNPSPQVPAKLEAELKDATSERERIESEYQRQINLQKKAGIVVPHSPIQYDTMLTARGRESQAKAQIEQTKVQLKAQLDSLRTP
jgi:predicted RNase H-like nuclease (RuvC/YqgF family)